VTEARATRFDAVLFDLLSALLDSWTLWTRIAGSEALARRWRDEAAHLTYAAGEYRPYADIVAEAGRVAGVAPEATQALIESWGELEPWPEAPEVVAKVGQLAKIGVVTNCSDQLGREAAARVGVPFDVVVTAESAGAYKPRPEPYRLAHDTLEVDAARTLFVAGSTNDIEGASRVGMPVWWHNRFGLALGERPIPLAQHDRLTELLETLKP
jgi:2-haloalkanoic acid dehalogenase type II